MSMTAIPVPVDNPLAALQRLAALGVQRFVVQLARPQQMLDPELGAAPMPAEAAQLWPYLEQLFPRFELREA